MEQTLTVKIRLLPSDDQQPVLDSTISAFQRALNFASRRARVLVKLDDDDSIRKSPSAAAIQKICYADIRDEFNLKSQQACSVCRAVAAAYKSIKSNGHQLSHPPVYKHAPLDLTRGHDYTIKDDFISITTLEEKRAKVRYHVPDYFKHWLGVGKLGTAKLFKKHGKYYFHVSVTIDLDDLDTPNENTMFVGVDRGMRFLMTTHDSKGKTRFYSGKEVREKRKQYKAKRRELQKKGTPPARRRLKEMGSRENRWMDDVNHCLSKALVTAYPQGTIFVLEDLSGIRDALVKVRRNNRYEQVSWAYSDLGFKLTYKAAMARQQVVFVNPAYSSQECPICEHVSKGNRDKSKHEFECEGCGYRSNDDRSAAMVLMGRGREKVLAELGGQGSGQPGSSQ